MTEISKLKNAYGLVIGINNVKKELIRILNQKPLTTGHVAKEFIPWFENQLKLDENKSKDGKYILGGSHKALSRVLEILEDCGGSPITCGEILEKFNFWSDNIFLSVKELFNLQSEKT
jgi:glucosamine 6-phosphate synthetase-like amidotransferase/phosphosugar isomerase protein